MIVLSFGYKKPQAGDKGSLFFPALEFDIQRLNDHNHDGNNSTKLTAQSIVGIADTISSAGWVSLGGGNYHQVVTMPPSTTFDLYAMAFRITSGPDTGAEIHPTIVKVGVNTYDIEVNDNTIDLSVLYLV